eukprot:gene4909-5052_t
MAPIIDGSPAWWQPVGGSKCGVMNREKKNGPNPRRAGIATPTSDPNVPLRPRHGPTSHDMSFYSVRATGLFFLALGAAEVVADLVANAVGQPQELAKLAPEVTPSARRHDATSSVPNVMARIPYTRVRTDAFAVPHDPVCAHRVTNGGVCSVLLDVPQECAGASSPCPLVLMYHGHGGNNRRWAGARTTVHDFNQIGVAPHGYTGRGSASGLPPAVVAISRRPGLE